MIILKSFIGRAFFTPEPRQFIEKDFTSDQWSIIDKAIERLIDHPVWTASFAISDKMKEIDNALQKKPKCEGCV